MKHLVEGVEKEVDETQEEFFPGYLEAVYHLFSIALKHDPLVVRLGTRDRSLGVHLPSPTPVTDFLMRRDSVELDHYEYGPTPHDEMLARAKQHYAPRLQIDGAEQIGA